MPLQSETLSENQITVMLQENNPLAWVYLYDKYAPAMYGLVCNLTEDKILAEEIFKNAFLELKQKQMLSEVKYALLPIILRHTHSYTARHLKEISVPLKTLNPPKATELIHLLTTQCNSLNQAASILNITAKETKRRLRVEFLNLRKQNNTTENVHRHDGISIEPLLQT